jgi:hypothetical protein
MQELRRQHPSAIKARKFRVLMSKKKFQRHIVKAIGARQQTGLTLETQAKR